MNAYGFAYDLDFVEVNLSVLVDIKNVEDPHGLNHRLSI